MIGFFLDQDNSGHWYVIDAARRKEWLEWTNLSEDDEASWEPPIFAVKLGGSPSMIVFPSFQTDRS